MAEGLRPANRPHRPLSPHLQVYRPLVNMVMSIMHRITGVVLYVGTVLLAAWLVSAALNRGVFDMVNGLLGSWPGQVVVLGFTWAYLHHLFGGVRHMIWDTGRGFDLATVNFLSWGTLVLSVLGTIGLWFAARMI